MKVSPKSDRFLMVLAAFFGWLIASGFLPGTSYGFLNDPVLGNIRDPKLGGMTIYPNFVAGLVTIAIVGYWLTGPNKSIEQ